MNSWIEIGLLEEIPLLGARVIETADGDIAIFRSSHDEVFALQDSCPHRGGALSQGIVHGQQVTCPLHNWVLELASGVAVPPDEGCAKRYPIRIEDGTLLLSLKAEEAAA